MSQTMSRHACFVTLLFLCATNAVAAPPPAAQVKIDFKKHIEPIFKNHCSRCHLGHKRKGGFSINRRAGFTKGGEHGSAVVIGQSAKSHLIEKVTDENPDERMPSKAKPLSAEQIGLLRAWIDQGLTWPEGFSFTKWRRAPLAPRKVKLPPGNEKANPIDRLVSAYWKKHKIKIQVELADDRVFARRVWLDLVGLLPPASELEVFVSENSPDKRARLVDRLLKDNKAYAEHWMTFWADMLRNAYRGTGYIDGGRKQITQWLYSALHQNMRYDQFVRELISPVKGSEGFIGGIKWRGNVVAAQRKEMQAAQNVGQVFLGTNLKCASCHDSFINYWRIKDVWALASVFADKPLEVYRCGKATGKVAQPAFLYPELGSIDPKSSKKARVSALAKLITDPKNGRLNRTMVNRFWAMLMGRGIVEQVDDMDQEPWEADLLDWLAVDLTEHHYDLKRTLRVICTSKTYQMQSVRLVAQSPVAHSKEPYVFRGPVTRRMSAEQFIDAISLLTRTAPGKPAARIRVPRAGSSSKLVRASLVNDDSLSRVLGRPNREQVVTQRDSLTTTLQALELTNGSTLDSKLKAGAKDWVKREGTDPARLVERLYLEALGRKPSKQEVRVAIDHLGKPVKPQAVEDLLWIVTMLPDFQLIR